MSNTDPLSVLGSSRWLTATGKRVGRVAVAATLGVLLVDAPLFAEGSPEKAPGTRKTVPREMQGDERAIHALNRLTFGPRPGDFATIQSMGIKNWFERQLNPSSIDDSKLDARLLDYPAVGLPLAELQRRYPSPQRLKQIIDGKLPLPSDPMERAMLQDQVAFYQMGRARAEQAKDENRATTVSMSGTSAKPGPSMEGPPANASEESDLRVDADRLISLPPDARVKAILAMAPADLVKLRRSLRPQQLEQMSAGLAPAQREMLLALSGSPRMVALESMETRLLRDISSERQLEAVMTDFWLNHFNVYVRKDQNEPYLIPAFERETIRPHALGNFEDLLVATARSPAMLVYLDNFRSTGPNSEAATRVGRFQKARPDAPVAKFLSGGLNENYGRELMELHTLGVNGGYTQADVTNVAKVFTGWGIDRPAIDGEYRFDERKHEPGTKLVLGKSISESGEREGLEVLHMLASSPATAHFLSEKLAVRFVSDVPPPALVDRMAASFLKSHGDIKSVLRTMFYSPEFWSADVYRAKVKTPLEFVASAARASDLQVTNPQSLVQSLEKLGMPLYGMPTPNGYSWKQDEWISTGALVSRMNFALVLSADKLPGSQTVWSKLLGAPPGTMPAAYRPESADTLTTESLKEQRLEHILLCGTVSDQTRRTVLAQSSDSTIADQAQTQFQLGGVAKRSYPPRSVREAVDQGNGTPDDRQAAVMAGLLLGSPEFQRR